MGLLKVILIFAVFATAIAEDAGLLNPCAIQDMECLSGTTQNFLERTSAGIVDYNIKPIDPLVIPELEYDTSDLTFYFKNINVTGLKNQKISDFKLNKDAKSVVLQTRVDDANIVADITLKLKPSGKSLSGQYFAKTTVLGTAKYNYELVPDKKGVEYFEVGPETITCEALGAPEVTLDPELTNKIAADPETLSRKEEYNKKAKEIRQAIMAQIFEKAYVTVIHNIRASAKVFPKTAFFKDI